MVKSPKIRHSKALTEPVTIELGADDVARLPPESQEGGTPGAAAGPSQADPVRADPAKAGPAEKREPTQAAAPDKPASDPKAAGGAKAGAAAPGPFGRESAAKPASPPPSQPRANDPAPPRSGTGAAVAGGLAGAVIALAVAGGGAWYAGMLPPSSGTVMPASDEIAALKNEISALRESVAGLEAAPAPAAGGDEAALADVNARVEGLATSIEALRGEIAELGAGSAPPAADGPALDELRAGLAALEHKLAALPADDGAAAEALRPEIARLDAGLIAASDAAAAAGDAARQTAARAEEIGTALEALAARVAEQDKAPAVALAIAASSLKAAVERGTPFTTELETYASLAPDAPEIAALRELAAAGVPTRAEIARGMNAAADAMVQAGRTVDPDAGFFARLWQSAQSLIKVRPVGEIEGTGVPAVVARVEAAVMAGDYAGALAEYDALPADAKAAGAPFMGKVRLRLTADEAVDRALAAALRA